MERDDRISKTETEVRGPYGGASTRLIWLNVDNLGAHPVWFRAARIKSRTRVHARDERRNLLLTHQLAAREWAAADVKKTDPPLSRKLVRRDGGGPGMRESHSRRPSPCPSSPQRSMPSGRNYKASTARTGEYYRFLNPTLGPYLSFERSSPVTAPACSFDYFL